VNWLKKPSTTGGIVYLIVVGMLVAGLVLVAFNAWRVGVFVVGLGFGLAFVMRLILPDHRAGMLRVRRRFLDLATLAMCSGVLLAMAILIPNRPH
jgi:TctA family transporter